MKKTNIFGEHHGLHAEGAADLAGQDTYILGLDTHHIGDVGAHGGNALRAHIKGEAIVLEGADGGARLHCVDHQAGVGDLQSRDMRRLGEGGVDRSGIAVMKVERDIARHVVINKLSAVSGSRFRRGDDGQGVDVDRNRLGGVLGLRHGLRDHAGDRVADIAHLADGQHLAARFAQWRAVAIGQSDNAFERAIALQFGAAIDAEHARHFPRRRHIDATDRAVGDGAAHHHHIGLPGQADVVGIAALAAQQLRILDPRHRLPDREFMGG